MGKPTLHEIAAMPFPASQKAMREHYDPRWHKEEAQGLKRFRVRFDWALVGTFDEIVEAEDEDEAKEIAREQAQDDAASEYYDFEVEGMKVTPTKGGDA